MSDGGIINAKGRTACYKARDAFFECLTANQAKKNAEQECAPEMADFHGVRSMAIYFQFLLHNRLLTPDLSSIVAAVLHGAISQK